MLRTLRRHGRRTLGLFTLAALVAAGWPARAADPSFDSQSTLAPRIAPQALSIDATIASMVRRGLLADVKPAAPAAGARPPPAPLRQRPFCRERLAAGVPAASACSQTRAPKLARCRLRRRVGVRPARQPSPPRPMLKQRLRLRLPSWSHPRLPRRSSPICRSTSRPTARSRARSRPPRTQTLAPPWRPHNPRRLPSLQSGTDSPIAEPPTSDDPLPDDHLAPIDALPETPAPAADAPGDPREPEIGDAATRRARSLPPTNAHRRLRPSGGAAKLVAQRPVAHAVDEPDRIEQPDDNVASAVEHRELPGARGRSPRARSASAQPQPNRAAREGARAC